VALDQVGAIQLLGDVASVFAEQIFQALLAALQDPWPRACGHGLTDGWGAARVADSLIPVP
jgi:hypothetical protein